MITLATVEKMVAKKAKATPMRALSQSVVVDPSPLLLLSVPFVVANVMNVRAHRIGVGRLFTFIVYVVGHRADSARTAILCIYYHMISNEQHHNRPETYRNMHVLLVFIHLLSVYCRPC
jgi:hypothetical protein